MSAERPKPIFFGKWMELVGLRPKFNRDNIRKTKGVQKPVVKKDLRHVLYKQCLDKHKEMKHKQLFS